MENLELYLKPFFGALIISFGLAVLIIKFARERNGIIDDSRSEDRHIHDKGKFISRWGGVAIIISFIVAIILDENLVMTNTLWGIIFGAIVVLAIGIYDDLKGLNWKIQLFFQSIAVSLLFFFGAKINYITNPFGDAFLFDTQEKIVIGIIVGFMWSLILINAMNWLDGIDGLSGGVTFIAAITIFILSLKPEVNQPPVGIISLVLAGSVLGFLILNFHPAKIMAGTSGAFFMGFVLAGLSFFAGTKIATTLLVLAIPIIDFFWVIGRRIKLKKSIFEADQEHLHHKLIRMGWSQKKISLFFYTVTILISVVALNIGASGKVAMIILLIILASAFFYIIKNHELKIEKQ